MAKTIQFKRGTTAQTNLFTGAVGEISVDTDKDVVVVHDGTTQGGFASAAKANNDNSINLINRAGTSLGTVSSAGLLTVTTLRASAVGTATAPALQVGTNTDNGLYAPAADNIAITTNGVNRFQIDDTGIQKSTIGTSATLYEDFICRAWINFNGSAVPTARGSGNISSITDTAVGNWTVNLIQAMPDVNFAITAAGGRYNDGRVLAVQGPNCYALSTSSIQVVTGGDTTGGNDWLDIYFAIFR